MGEGCERWSAAELRRRAPDLASDGTLGALYSPHELRVESRDALPRLTTWLAETYGVAFRWQTAAHLVAPPRIETSRGPIAAETAIICPGDDFTSLMPERIAAYGVRRCRLSMLRLASPGFRLPSAVMSDLSLVRYRGYADLPEAAALRDRLADEQPDHLAHGVHLIVVQSADGSLVVGDSHHYDAQPWPFAEARSEGLILDEFARAADFGRPEAIERWTGEYAVADDRTFFMDSPAPAVRLVIVTSGTGASTAFGIAERTLTDLFGA
jgi:D-hydroxyproline dehydrogenase subunit beta